MSAAGQFIPPIIVFHRQQIKSELMDGSPPGSVYHCHPSGWMQIDIFTDWFRHLALAKVCCMIKGRKGISIPITLQLYKTLIRPHMEYALPVWASHSDHDMRKLDQTQVQCLKSLIGAKVCSSSAAVEVVCGIIPMRFRKRELCCREYVRLLTKDAESSYFT